MTTFGWKRKAGQNIVKDIAVKHFKEEDNEEHQLNKALIQTFKRRKQCLQENRLLKFEEHKINGIKFAESQRFKEAVEEWDNALNLVPNDYKVLEMRAQALLQLNLPFPAIQSAEKAVKINPCWWIGFQTLGRSQLGIGDLEMAKRSFSKAIHLNPVVDELWDEDLKWTIELIKKKKDEIDKEKIIDNKDINDSKST